MDINEWWGLVHRAREAAGDRADDRDLPEDPLPDALTGVLAALEPAEIVDFAATADEVTQSAYRRPLWNAAYLIEGGCGDDGFMDFRDGLVLLGREVFTRAVADPDSLAALPVVVRMSRGKGGWIGYESLDGPAREAYARAGGSGDEFYAAVAAADQDRIRLREPGGESWDAEDAEATRRNLPRLAALFLD
ncbi:DUF4240 domain-containing protein [Streptomyces sp. cmx-18-6]|uniref:DUF4240 domain-containing protein n=1 Tax=Streptomyces sp. cmx-18-6 TaxID=2790930 RepID=UPI00397FCC4D